MRSLFFALSVSFLSFTAHASLIESNIVDNFANGDFMSVPGQNKGNYEVRDIGGGLLNLSSEAWTYISIEDLFGLKSLNFDNGSHYTFNFEMRIKTGNNKPGGPSEIGGFMLANDNVNNIGAAESIYALNLSGTQNWGDKTFKYDFDNLTANDSPTWQSFSIDLEDFFSGDYEYLVFINDCDASNCSNTTQFRNMSVQVPEPQTLALLALSLFGLRRLRK